MLAFHGVFSAYGFWLPNDPRGSWSDWVASWELYNRGGRATLVQTQRSLAAVSHDAAGRMAAKAALKRPPVVFSGIQARAIARGFATAVAKSRHQILACAILPNHVHVVVAASHLTPNRIIGHLKREASLQLLAEAVHPFESERRKDGSLPSCWAENCWRVFLDREADVHRAICYVEQNPIREGKRRQCWSFVQQPPNR